MMIPDQLLRGDIGYLIVKSHGKEPVEKAWQNNLYEGYEDRFLDALNKGFNYGISPLTRKIAIVDGDTEEIRKAMENLRETFWYSTGKGVQYVFELTYGLEKNMPLIGGAYVKTLGGYAVGPGSIHPNGKKYGEAMSENNIAMEDYDKFMEVIKPFILIKKTDINPTQNFDKPKSYTHGEVQKLIESIEDVWAERDGMRHDLTLALVGTMKRYGWSEADAMNMIAGLVQKTGKGREHIIQVQWIYRHGGGREYGIPTLLAIRDGTWKARS